MHLSEPGGELLPCVLSCTVISGFQLSELRVELFFLLQQMISPDVGFEHRVKGGRIVTYDLLLDEEDGDMCRDGDFSQCDVAEQG